MEEHREDLNYLNNHLVRLTRAEFELLAMAQEYYMQVITLLAEKIRERENNE